MCPHYVEKKTIYYKTVWGAFTNRLSFIVTVATRKEIIANEARTLFQAKNGEINYMFDGIDRTRVLSYQFISENLFIANYHIKAKGGIIKLSIIIIISVD